MDIPIQRKSSKLKRRITVVLIIMALLVTSLLYTASHKGVPSLERSSIWLGQAASGLLYDDVKASGRLVPVRTQWIDAEVGGAVDSIAVHSGEAVRRGDIILVLRNRAIEEALKKAEVAYAESLATAAARSSSLRSQLLDREQALEAARNTLKIQVIRTRAQHEAFQKGALARIDDDESKMALAQDQQLLQLEQKRMHEFKSNMAAQIRAIDALSDESQNALLVAQQDRAGLTVRSAIDGVVQQLSVEPGQDVQAGHNMARIVDPNRLLVRLLVPEQLAKNISLGVAAQIAVQGTTVAAKVSRIDPSVENNSVAVDATLSGKLPAGSRPDLSVDGDILLRSYGQVLSVNRPANVVANSRSEMFVVDEVHHQAIKRLVSFGAVSSDRIIVLSGLVEGEQIIMSDTSTYSRYARLKLR